MKRFNRGLAKVTRARATKKPLKKRASRTAREGAVCERARSGKCKENRSEKVRDGPRIPLRTPGSILSPRASRGVHLTLQATGSHVLVARSRRALRSAQCAPAELLNGGFVNVPRGALQVALHELVDDTRGAVLLEHVARPHVDSDDTAEDGLPRRAVVDGNH